MRGRRGLRVMRAGGMIATLVSVAPAISQDTDVSVVQIPVTSVRKRVGGSDRCEGRQTNAAVARACARAIETRSGEFAATDAPVLSPEQRLLVDQRGREPSTSLRGAQARRRCRRASGRVAGHSFGCASPDRTRRGAFLAGQYARAVRVDRRDAGVRQGARVHDHQRASVAALTRAASRPVGHIAKDPQHGRIFDRIRAYRRSIGLR